MFKRIVLSVYILFHLFCVLLAPMPENIVLGQVSPWIDPYLQFTAFDAGWEFFAPDPRMGRQFVEWETLDANGQITGQARWPDLKNPYWLTERHNRRVFMAGFMVTHPARAERMTLSWACRSSQADSVRLWRSSFALASMPQKIRSERVPASDDSSVRELVSHSFCEGLR